MVDPSSEVAIVEAPRVAYLINQYPKVSHSFIRREIQALEKRGLAVLRIAVRGWSDVLADPADLDERRQTRYVLERGLGALLLNGLRYAVTRPMAFLKGLRLAVAMSSRSDRSILHHGIYLLEACEVDRWLRAERIDHLHAHFGTNPAEVAMFVRALGGATYSFTVHGPEEFDKPEALGLRRKGELASFVVAISSYGRSQLYRWLPQADWPKVAVVHCGLDAAFHEVAATPIDDGNARLVCVGRICEQKGQLLLVRALHRLVERGSAVELVLAGDGEMRAEVERLVDELGVASRVRVTGWIGSGQVRDEILAARALVLPSFAEGLPVVLMEAMALGRPVITTYIAGIPELVHDGDAGWLVPAGDLDALVAAIEQCLALPPERLAAMGRAARERALERHDVDHEASKLQALFAPRLGLSTSPSIG